jgi:hypothetical protein
MEMQLDQSISLLDRVKIQSELLVPLLRDLREELGEEIANEIVFKSLRKHLKNHYQLLAEAKPGSGKDKWAALTEEMLVTIGDDVEIEHLRDDAEALNLNVTGCRYAQHFLQIQEPELGSILTCELDYHTVSVSKDEVTLKRPRTIMQGDAKCEFRYQFRNNRNGA